MTEVRGREALKKFYGAIKRNFALPCIHNHLITLSGDEATGTCSIEVRIARDGKSMIGSGYYEDRFRRENGRWKFMVRDCTFFISCRFNKVGPTRQSRSLCPYGIRCWHRHEVEKAHSHEQFFV